jgi:starch synthase (maltosyl-transferring)
MPARVFIQTMKVRIGNQTSFSAVPVLLPFEYAAAHGFDAFEWLPDKKESGEGWTVEDIPATTRAVIRETAAAKDISLSVHMSIQARPLIQASDERYWKDIEFAKDIGATLFNIHFSPDDGIEAYAEAILPLAKILSQSKIKLSIENTFDTTPQDFNKLFKYLNKLHSHHNFAIGMCLDIGHANLCNSTRNDYLRYIDLLDPETPIIHIHLHENYGDYDSHLPIFTGPAGTDPAGIKRLIARLKKRGFSGSIILEQWPQPAELLDDARNRILDMISGDTASVNETTTHKISFWKTYGTNEAGLKRHEGMIIYNLFPLLAGKFIEWESHLSRAAQMGFTWVFVNPVQLPGASGSIYSIKDYFSFNPLLVDLKSRKLPIDQAKEVIKSAENFGLKMMVDLVINHCAADSDLVRLHPEWFVHKANGRIAHPFADENGKKVVWKDLAQFDHRNTKDKEGLYRFSLDVVMFLAELGFKGFRCDAAYQIPKGIWERLIKKARETYPDLLFFAETLGTTPALTRKTANAGFDYIFNSSKWWDFESLWLMQQYDLTRDIAPSVSFPESHDTVRLCEELYGNIDGLKQRYLFSSLFSAGLMMPIGFEFGFRQKLHVVNTRPKDWEKTEIDLTSFIREVNKIKAEHIIFQEEAPTEMLPCKNPQVLLMWKTSTRTQEEALLILNKDIHNRQSFYEENLQKYLQAGAPLIDISPGYPVNYIPTPFSYSLQPGQGIVLITSRDPISGD